MSEISVSLASSELVVGEGRDAVTVSVTNGAPGPLRVVVGAYARQTAPTGPSAPGEPAAPRPADPRGWIRVADPLREIPPGSTEQYALAVDAGAAPAGTHVLRVIAYPSHRAPEEYSDEGVDLTVVVPESEPEPPKPRRWWLVALVGGVVLAVAVVAFVLSRAGDDPPPPPPPPQATLDVTVSGTGVVLVDGEACAAPCSVSRDEGASVTVTVDGPTFPQIFEGWSGGCSGTEDCVVTLAADTSVTASFGEAPVSPEDCLPYDRDGLEIRLELVSFPTFRFVLTDGASRMLVLDTSADAQAALAVAQASSAQCFVGRPDAELTYWRSLGTGAPAVADPDCIAHDRNALRIVGEGSTWRLLDGPNHLMATFSSEADAGRGMVVAMEHDQRCFVGRSSPPAETSYWLP